MLKIAALFLLRILAACSITTEPIVSDYNGDSVHIQLDGLSVEFMDAEHKSQTMAQADAEAQRICQQGHRKRAERVSQRNLSTGQYSYVIDILYLCLK